MTCPPGTAGGGRFFFLAVVLGVWAGAPAAARADHALEFSPSFYPHEIRIDVVNPAAAAKLFAKYFLHAYVGGDPFAGMTPPANLGHVESLGSFLVGTFDGAAPMGDRDARCEGARRLASALAAGKERYVFHPYPVTPFHPDYLRHFDLVESAKKPSEASVAPKIRVKGKVAEQLVPPAWRSSGPGWDATVEAIDAQDLLRSARISLNGWLGPPWIKEGWFHAYLLLAPSLREGNAKQAADAIYQRLVTGAYEGQVERINLERRLVEVLRGGCERAVLGYTVRREYFNNSDYSEGVENVGYDAQAGLNAPIFIRTVKLKDFLWNGWLRVGVATPPRAAWNPLGGFTDPAGQLIWAAVADPAEFPAPFSATWVANRVTATIGPGGSPSGGVEVPADALLPEPITGVFRPVGTGKTARAKIVYRVLLSSFHDQTPMTAADLLYPLSFAYRPHDPFVDASTALLRDWLAGVRLGRAERDIKDFGETKFTFQVQMVEVYVKHRLTDPAQLASVVAPWSTLPWQLIALMEEAAKRGIATFSEEEAKRRGVPWLDLVRDQRAKERLAALVEEFRGQGYVPTSLKGLVTAAEARTRWAALKDFYAKNRHFLVTNGPYRLHQWSGDSVVLQAFRDPSYPVGLASFNQYAIPRRAYVSQLEVRDARLEVRAEVEKVFAFQRSYKLVREPFRGQAGGGDAADLPLCRYVVVGSDGSIASAGSAPLAADGAFRVTLAATLKPGLYTLLVALYLGGNEVNPEVKTMPLTLQAF